MARILLPPQLDGKVPAIEESTRQITIIGGNGAGKSLFMDEMKTLNGDRSYVMDVLSAFYPEREESTRRGSIDSIYRDMIRQRSYMRADAVSELDKIVYMLFSDEVESLLQLKTNSAGRKNKVSIRQTKLDTVRRIWERIFPGNKIICEGGMLRFSTASGRDLISTTQLSQGEKAVLYYLGATVYAMPHAVIFIDSPSLFVHSSILGSLWNSIEELRADCTFVYNSVDVDFVSTRSNNTTIWVKRYDSGVKGWDYALLGPESKAEELLVEFAGSRRPVLFIEGDSSHSIDIRLYSLVFPGMTIRPLGSCNKVIETTRSFNDQSAIHHLNSLGIVDRDRRTEQEVEYLRRKQIMVPDVAEIENIFLLRGVIMLMAKHRGRDGAKIMRRVERDIIRMFKHRSEEQALQHVRHKVKREVECKIDARFSCITALETHLRGLPGKLQPRKHYNALREQFAVMVRDNDYESILRVFNHKPILPDSGVHQQLGYHNKEDYIQGVLDLLKSNSKDAETLRNTILHCLRAPGTGIEN